MTAANPNSPSSTPNIHPAIAQLRAAGTSVWLDDLSRPRLESGNLLDYINSGVAGVTTNPAIFAKAMTTGDAYKKQLAELAGAGANAEAAVFAMAEDDVRAACDAFAALNQGQNTACDGYVSLEVDPRLAADHTATVAQAKQLAANVGRRNLMIKIPATEDCLESITEVLGCGISVNVTLIFSVTRYIQVMEAFLDGLEAAQRNGHDLRHIHSVASFFVSRVDTAIDRKLAECEGVPEELFGQAAIANARIAYAAFQEHLLHNPRFQELAKFGANVQRPLWASTSVKNPDYPDTRYVTELVGPHTVNTMPEATLQAVLDHGTISGDTLSGTARASHEIFARISEYGIDVEEVWEQLEADGVQQFVDSWQELLAAVATALQQQQPPEPSH